MRRTVERVRAIARRYSELNGRVSAAAITLYGLFALFALCVLGRLVVVVTIIETLDRSRLEPDDLPVGPRAAV